MERQQIISILEQLARGFDPITGAPVHDVFAGPDVIRALFLAADALKMPVGTPAANRPGAAGVRWTDQEDALLCSEFDGGTPIPEIARAHNRTRGAITSRLVKLGRIAPETVRVRDRGAALPA